MEVDLTKISLDVLKNLFMKKFEDLFNLKLETDPDAAKVEAIEKLMEKLNTEILSREKDEKSESTGKSGESKPVVQQVATRDFTTHKIKNMSTTVTSEIPVFSSGHDVHIWLTKLDSYHKLFVVGDSSGVMEEHFLQVAKSRLCPEYLNAMMASKEDTSSYTGMIEYMKKHHASKLSVFQILDTIWEMDKSESETLRDYGIRLDDKATEARNIISAKLKEFIKDDESRPDKEMTDGDVFSLLSGQVFLQYLKNKRQVIYNNVCNDLDSTWSAAEIANKAMTYSDRMSNDNSKNQADVPQAFPAKVDNKQSNTSRQVKNCYKFLLGKCTEQQCPFYHDEGALKVLKNSATGSNSSNGSNSGKGVKPKKKKNKNGQSQPQTAAAQMASGEPVLPLPTQDFRI